MHIKDVAFISVGDDHQEFQVFETKLNIIRKYFPFDVVTGSYSNLSCNLYFDKYMHLQCHFKNDQFTGCLYIEHTCYKIDVHPFNSMGGFDEKAFEKQISEIADREDNENVVTLAIVHKGKALKTVSFLFSDLDHYELVLMSEMTQEGDEIKEEKAQMTFKPSLAIRI